MKELPDLLDIAIEKRSHFFDEKHEAAFRLFNGFLEGYRDLVIDVYAKCFLIHWYAKDDNEELIAQLGELLSAKFDWIDSILVKSRGSKDKSKENGYYLFQKKKTTWIRENGTRYSVDLSMNRDASFYLDTRSLRSWLKKNSEGKSILNTFAYTGSLGVAALAGGASRVVQSDLNKSFLNVAKTSCTLNGFPIVKGDYQSGDFWKHMNALKRKGELFDIVVLDPPFFAETKGGRVDLAQSTKSMINKVRPLVVKGGKIVFVNNALFVSGADLEKALDELYDEWLVFDERIDIDSDFLGDPSAFVSNPEPYNHSTKITVLKVNHR